MSGTWEVVVDDSHTDNLGHLNHVQAVRYLELARDRWYRACGLFDGEDGAKRGTVVVNINYDYRDECFLGETLTVTTEPVRLGRKSFMVHHRIVKPNGSVAIEGDATSVVMDMSARATVPVPEPIARFFPTGA